MRIVTGDSADESSKEVKAMKRRMGFASSGRNEPSAALDFSAQRAISRLRRRKKDLDHHDGLWEVRATLGWGSFSKPSPKDQDVDANHQRSAASTTTARISENPGPGPWRRKSSSSQV